MHSEFFRKTTIGIPWQQWQSMLANRFYVIQLINLKTNSRECRILSSTSFKSSFPRHWKLLTQPGEKHTWFRVKGRPYAISASVLLEEI